MADTDSHTIVVNLDDAADSSAVVQLVQEIVQALDADGIVEQRDLDERMVQLLVLVRGGPAAASAREQIAGLEGVRDAFVKPPEALP